MTLAELLTALDTAKALHPARVKDMKTSLGYLAKVLGQSTPEQCSVGDACRDPATWTTALDTHFAQLTADGRTISAATRRNTRNNLRVVFRLAEAHGLLEAPLPPRLLTKPRRNAFERQQRATAPYQTTYHPQTGPRRFGLPQAAWPPDIQAGWRAYRAQCGLRLRETTVQAYVKCLATYFGYLAHICHRTPTWEDLFQVETLTEFLRWHGARLERPISAHGQRVVITIAAMATVLKHPARQALAALRKTLPTPAPLHIKRHHMVSLRELEAVADACLAEGRVPYIARAKNPHPGSQRATQFQHGVMLKLLVRVPLRQRNVRELRLEKHLYKNEVGHWVLHFSGDDLKIGERQGRVNEYKLDLTATYPELIPVLEEWLREYRPRLPGAATSPLCFLTQYGRPFTQGTLRAELASAVALRTGQRFYPHLIRTIWATECLTDDDAPPDWTTVAVMLGDTVATVMAHYHDLVDQAHHPKAKALVAKRLRTG